MRFALLLALAVSSTAIAAPKKSPIPNEASQKASLTLVMDVYKPEIAKAKLPAQKIEFAKKLLAEGIATKRDNTGRYVLLKLARDLSSQQGDLATALAAIDQMDDDFEIDKLPQQIEAGTSAAKRLKAFKEYIPAAMEMLIPLVDVAIEADRYEEAKQTGNLLISMARDIKDTEQIKLLALRVKDIDEMAAEFLKVKEAMVKLESQPTNPELNLLIGKFRCFTKNDWTNGVAMLALGGASEFKAAALLELADAPDPQKVGDAWWEISETITGRAKESIVMHAVEWYELALPKLDGLPKTRVERQIAKAEEILIASKRKPASRPLKILATQTTTWPNSTKNFAKLIDKKSASVGMGDQAFGIGGAGFLLEDVRHLKLELNSVGVFSVGGVYAFSGFIVQFGTKQGFKKTVCMSLFIHKDLQMFVSELPWTGKLKPEVWIEPGKSKYYEISLRKYAPPDWDGKIWLTFYCRNAGNGVSLTGRIVDSY